jgi:glycosyltransferase involved in cell wall biosynthesis
MQAALGDGVRRLVLPPTISPPAPTQGDAADLSAAGASIRLLTVTNLNYREKAQGVILIAGALERLLGRQASATGIQYDVVGGGYQLEFLRQAIGANAAIRLHGRSDNVAEFYRRADIFVYCSTLDGYPLVLCEAQSFGLPIVANRWGAFPDMLNQDQDALFFDADDPAEIDRVLERLITDKNLRRRLGQGALVNFDKNNSSARCGKRLQQFLQGLAE